MVVNTVRAFVENEIYPLEKEVEKTGLVPDEIGQEIKNKVLKLGFFAPNFLKVLLQALFTISSDGDKFFRYLAVLYHPSVCFREKFSESTISSEKLELSSATIDIPAL